MIFPEHPSSPIVCRAIRRKLSGASSSSGTMTKLYSVQTFPQNYVSVVWITTRTYNCKVHTQLYPTRSMPCLTVATVLAGTVHNPYMYNGYVKLYIIYSVGCVHAITCTHNNIHSNKREPSVFRVTARKACLVCEWILRFLKKSNVIKSLSVLTIRNERSFLVTHKWRQFQKP